ncbi:MAG: M48 family peptidase [Clostridia bacterium]|nr:M48 family peptidase [Clostridia bacterium]
MKNTCIRTVSFCGGEIAYQLEQKPVKNLNLRIRRDGSVYVSANERVSPKKADEFVLSKCKSILAAQKRYEQFTQNRPKPKEYVNGEIFYIQGRGLQLMVSQGPKDTVETDGTYIILQVKNPDDLEEKQRTLSKFFDRQCREVFGELMGQIYPQFQKHGVSMPVLRIRDMETRWGSCLSAKGIITLNKRLLYAPRGCIEYVVMHEFCHFIHPNHSKEFYNFMATLMPDWKEQKNALNNSSAYWQ